MAFSVLFSSIQWKLVGSKLNWTPNTFLWTKTDYFKAYSNQMICLCLVDVNVSGIFYFLQLLFPDSSTSEASDDPVALMKTGWSQMRHMHSETSVLLVSACQRIKRSTWSITNLMIYSQHSVAHLTLWHGWTDTHMRVHSHTCTHARRQTDRQTRCLHAFLLLSFLNIKALIEVECEVVLL